MVVRRAVALTHEDVLRAAEEEVSRVPAIRLLSWKAITHTVRQRTGHDYSESTVRHAFRRSEQRQRLFRLSDKGALLQTVCEDLVAGEAFSRSLGRTRSTLRQLLESEKPSWPEAIHGAAIAIFDGSMAATESGIPTKATGFRLRSLMCITEHEEAVTLILRDRLLADRENVIDLYVGLFKKFERVPTRDPAEIIAALSALEDGFLMQAISVTPPPSGRRWCELFADAAVDYLTTVTLPAARSAL